jgi:hypothetical protein
MSMTDSHLSLIGHDPAVYRQNVIVRGSNGPDLFSSIVQPFQADVLCSIDLAFTALREDRMPPVSRLWWEASKGSGKDLLASLSILWLMAFARRDLTIQVGAADRAQADELRKSALSVLRLNSWLADFLTIQNFAIVNSGTGSRCDIIASDEFGSHGSRPSLVVLNELVHHSSDGFSSTVMDNLAKVRHGVGLILTNAGSVGTWQFQWRELARTSKRWAFHRYDRPAPWVDAAELQERRISTNESRFRRLWYGCWAHENESALSDAAIENSITLSAPALCRQSADQQFFGGLDLAVSQDRSAFAVLSRAPEQKTRLAECRSWLPPRAGKVDLMEVEEFVFEAHQRYQFSVVNYDPYQCELLAQRLRTKGCPMVGVPFTAANLQEMAGALLESFNSGTIAIYDHPQLISDLRALRFIERGNSFRLDAPRSAAGHADLGTAFVLSLLAVKRNPIIFVHPFIDRPLVPFVFDSSGRLVRSPLLDVPREDREAFQQQQARREAEQPAPILTALGAALAENNLSDPENW